MSEEVTNKGTKEGNVLAGFVLYKDKENIDWNKFRENMKNDWNIEVKEEVKDNSIVFRVDDMVVACTLMPNPIPNGEAESASKYNILWKDGYKEVAQHKAHVMLAVMNKFDALEQAMLFAKVACSLLKIEGSIGLYKDPTVYESKFYIQFAETIKDGEYPMPILIYVGMYLENGGLCAFTSGMRYFGYEEIEIINSRKEPDEVIGFLLSIAEYVVSEKVELKDGETIGFSEEQKLPISVNEGVSVKGNSIKIEF